MEGPPDWDLLAVVRSCSSTTTTATTTAPAAADPHPPPPQLPPPPPQRQQQQQLCFSPTTSACTSSSSVLFGFSTALSNTSTSFYSDLQDICKPLICSLNSSSATLSPPISSSSLSLSQFRHVVKPSHVVFGGSSTALSNTSTSSSTTSHSQRAKKRKNLMKKVCHVPAEGLSSDMWAWRKYGQKPIKGSPYPRGYYRCSSSKGCLARKQVERNRTDPKMFIVTYTSEHNHPMPTHRNSLAGSTRQKTTTTPPEHPPCSSPSATTAATTLSPLTEPSESKTEGDDMMMTKDDEYDDDDMRELSDLMLSDDFYVGFEQIDGGSDDSDCFSEQFSPSSSEFPWLSNGGSTATAAGGT